MRIAMTTDRPWTGRTILTALLITFGIVFAVNGVFVFFAVKTWPGFSENNAYEKGLRYNDVLNAARQQKELGWRTYFEATPDGGIQVGLIGPAHGLIDLARAEVVFERPLGDPATRIIKLSQAPDGAMRAQMTPLPAGIWHATVFTEEASGRSHHMQYVIEIRP